MALTTIDDRGLKTPIDLLDNEKIRFGTGNDLEIFHDASNSYIKDTGTGELRLASNQFTVQNAAADETLLYAVENGAVGLKYDDSLKLETSSTGGILRGTMWTAVDNTKVAFGTGDDLQIYHDGTRSWVRDANAGNLIIDTNGSEIDINSGGNAEYMARFIKDGAVELYHNNVKKLDTASGGINVVGFVNVQSGGHVYLEDDGKLNVGTSNDLQIYHTGGANFIETGSQIIHIQSDSSIRLQKNTGNENMLIASADGAVQLYYDNSKKLETVSAGAKIYQDLDLIGDTPQLKFDDTTSSGYQSYINTNNNELKIMASSGGFGVYCGTDANGASNTTQRFWVNGEGLVRLPTDDSKLQIGASQDLQIYHDGNNSYIEDAGTGSLILKTGRVSFNDTGNNEMGRFDGEGLKFNGDSAAANALDDYEEGTFTPAMSNAYSNITYFSQNGLYVKIGRMVHCTIAVAMTAATAEGPQIKITNLPFTSHANNYSSGGITYCDFNSTFVDTDPYISGNTSEVRFYKKATGSAVTGDSTNITSTKWLGIGITYQV